MEKRGVQQSHLRQPCVVGVKQSKKRGITALALRGAPLSSSVPQRACKKANGGRFRESLIQVHSDVQCWGLAIFFPPNNLRPVYPNGFALRRMGLTLTGKYILLFLAVQIGELPQFRSFNDCTGNRLCRSAPYVKISLKILKHEYICYCFIMRFCVSPQSSPFFFILSNCSLPDGIWMSHLGQCWRTYVKTTASKAIIYWLWGANVAYIIYTNAFWLPYYMQT